MSDSVNKRKIEYDKSRTRLLFFGFIRPYKGITTLLDALKISDQIAKFELHIVGECWDDVLRLAIDEMVNDPDSNISANLNFVSDEVAAELFSWTDFVMLPYLSATGSGVLSQAISYRKPVIASAMDPFGSTIRESLDGYLHETGSAAKLAACLDALAKGDLQIPTDPWTTNPKVTPWEELARGIAAL
jgi:glycosyltransferase involved in cell wall biosynthesis